MELQDSNYRAMLRRLGDEPGDDCGNVILTLTDAAGGGVFELPTTALTLLGDMAIHVTHADGRRALYPLATAVASITDASAPVRQHYPPAGQPEPVAPGTGAPGIETPGTPGS